jgi:hypothetical protein
MRMMAPAADELYSADLDADAAANVTPWRDIRFGMSCVDEMDFPRMRRRI